MWVVSKYMCTLLCLLKGVFQKKNILSFVLNFREIKQTALEISVLLIHLEHVKWWTNRWDQEMLEHKNPSLSKQTTSMLNRSLFLSRKVRCLHREMSQIPSCSSKTVWKAPMLQSTAPAHNSHLHSSSKLHEHSPTTSQQTDPSLALIESPAWAAVSSGKILRGV